MKKKILHNLLNNFSYRKVGSSNTSQLEAHAGSFTLLMKGIFNPYDCDLLTKVYNGGVLEVSKLRKSGKVLLLIMISNAY